MEDEFHDNPDVLPETAIRFSKITAGVFMVVGIILMASSLLFFKGGNEQSWMGAAILAGGIFLAIFQFLRLRNDEPQLILDSRGITHKNAFFPWEAVSEEEAVIKGYGKHIKHLFLFQFEGRKKTIDIAAFDTNVKKLNKLLLVYRGRHTQLSAASL